MWRQLLFVFLLLNLSAALADDLAVFIDAGDTQGLITAIEKANDGSGPDLIFIRPGPNGETTFTFTQAYMNGLAALPIITTNIEIFPVDSNNPRITFRRDDNAPQFRFATVLGDNRSGFGLGVFNIENFSVDGRGGAIFANQDASVTIRGVSFRNNFASEEGGAIHMEGNSRLFVRGTGRLSAKGPAEFKGNRASQVGGAISIQGNATANISHSVFADNNAGVFGCDINVNSSSNAMFGVTLSMQNNSFAADCGNVLFENPRGRMLLRNNTFAGMGDGIDSTDDVQLFANIFNLESTTNKKFDKAVCNDFGSNAFSSLGYNLSNESSCKLDQSNDMPNTDPMVNPPDAEGVVSLKSGSPAIDAGPSEMLSNASGPDFLPCGYIDSRGLGRPQDANGDGVFECDIGHYEVQGGEDLTLAHSGAFFDTGRSGEGVFVEMLSATQVWLAMFTYDPNGSDLMWFVGVGSVVGNSVIVDEVLRTQGGVFGSAFNADDITNTRVGSMSMVFPDCQATGRPGRMVFEADAQSELENLLVESSRLTRILSCGSNNQTHAASGRSGSFFDPQRSGEGVFVEVLDDGTPLVTMYSYTPTGEQFWMISDGAQIIGDTITAPMIYAASTTGFGSQFNGAELNFQPWGTLTMKYQPGCNAMDFSYQSSVTGFGSGQYNYQRLTSLAGTTCDL